MKQPKLGQRIRQKRLELGWTQDVLAKKCRLSRLYILKVEKNQIKSPGVQALDKIIRAFGIEVEPMWK